MIVDNKFKFQAQDSNLEYLYLVDLEKELHFLKKKKTPLTACTDVDCLKCL